MALTIIQAPLTRADQNNSNGSVTINATGQAFPIGKTGNSSSAILNLSGAVGGEEVKFEGLTGNLQIGSTNYALKDGQGQANSNGEVELHAKANGGHNGLELTLHGKLQGSSVVFSMPESKLSSLYLLSLTGQMTLSASTTTNSSGGNDNEGEGHSNGHSTTVTQTQNITVFEISTKTQNNTQTITQTIATPQNVTVTEFSNSTITVIQTGTNSTITETTTSTVANTTITETTTAANTTITVST
jgi:hypothetical protein